MITGIIKSQVDKVWDAFWSGGISNPLEVIEQITYLLFLRRLDDLQINAENRARRLGTPIEHRAYPEGDDARGRPYEDLRWTSRASRLGKVLLTKADHYIDEADLASLGARPIPQGSVLFAKIGEAMRHNHRVIAGCDMLVDNNAIAAIPGPQVTSAYLYHYLRTVNMYEMASTTAVPSVRKSQLESVRMPLPPLGEQRRIAEVLDRAEALRAKRRAAITQLDTLTQSIFLDMFGDLSADAERSTRLGEVLTCVTSGSRGWAEYYAPSGARFIRSLDVRMNQIANASAVFVDPPSNAEARRTEVQVGDVLLTITGSRIGRVERCQRTW